jgi:small subunit ribosomal protein S6
MPLYEHVFLARPDVSQAQVDAMTKEYSDVITEGGGKIVGQEYWGLKNLTYKIKKSRKAHYTMLRLDTPPAAVAEMERRMGISTDVLRFMTVRVEAHETEPSAMLRKQDREERSERGFGGPGGGGRGGPGGGRGPRPPRGDRPQGEDRGTFRPRPQGDRPPRAPRSDAGGQE